MRNSETQSLTDILKGQIFSKKNSGRPGGILFRHPVHQKQSYIFLWPEKYLFENTSLKGVVIIEFTLFVRVVYSAI